MERPDGVMICIGFYMIDDHEVLNDWDGQATEAVYATARSAWLRYAGRCVLIFHK